MHELSLCLHQQHQTLCQEHLYPQEYRSQIGHMQSRAMPTDIGDATWTFRELSGTQLIDA